MSSTKVRSDVILIISRIDITITYSDDSNVNVKDTRSVTATKFLQTVFIIKIVQ